MEEKILNMMKLLGISREEAIEVIKCDEDIDHDKKMDFDLTPEQEKNAKKMRATGQRAVDAYGKVRTRERKADEDKRFLINAIAECLKSMAVDNLDVTNIEREINFEYNNRRFKIVLSAPRK